MKNCKTQKKFLILNFGGIGDQILFFPVLETLKKIHPNSFITLVTESRSSAVNQLTELIDEVFVCNLKQKTCFSELYKLLKKAYKTQYDMVISSGSSPLISVLLLLTGIKERIGYDSGFLSRVLLTKAVKLNKEQYAANMYHDLMGDSVGADPCVCPNKVAGRTHGCAPTIVIHPGASKLAKQKGILKCWATEHWIKLIEKLNATGDYKVILTGGPDDEEIMHVFREKFPENIAETCSLKDFVDIVNNADMLVCVDSAPMHIGVGLRKRVIALFGPTDEKKLLPKNELFTAIKNDNLDCRPCLWDKRQKNCETSDCLNITPADVFCEIEQSSVCRQNI